MRILHSSDWHLGRTLDGRSRQAEQEQFIEELCHMADEEEVQLVLVAGDIFDTYNPPAHAEELYCHALEKLTNSHKRAVVVIAGNHDSPDRLRAVSPLALRHGAFIVGMPSEHISFGDRGAGIRLLGSGPGWLQLGVPSVPHPIVVSALPYPSEARLQQVLSHELHEVSLRESYSKMVNELFTRQASSFHKDSVNIAMSHIFVLGGLSSESERPIEIGGACTVDVGHLPAQAQYIALGHLHKAQSVKNAPAPAFYSGSPLAYSFSEASQTKSVYLVDVEPRKAAAVKSLNLSSGIPLERWQCREGLDEALSRLEAINGNALWLDLEIHSPRFLTMDETSRLRDIHAGIINIRCVVAGDNTEITTESISTLSIPELFTRFYRHRKGGVEPGQELVELFTTLTNRAMAEAPEDGVEV